MHKLYHYKPLDFGFIVLCPNCNISHLKNTVRSIKMYYSNKIVIVLPNSCEKEDELNKDDKVIKGGQTIASMINSGLKESSCREWNFIITPKGWIKNRIDIKYSYFIETNKDILFPIINRDMNFIDADINGTLIHKNSFLDIGELPNINSLNISKTIWASRAIDKKYNFKGIIGGRVF